MEPRADTLLLSRKEVEGLLTTQEVLESVEKTFQGMGEGTVVNPAKAGLDLGESSDYPPYKGLMNAMPAYVGWLDSAGLKWVGGFRDNPGRGLAYISSMMLLIDPQTGQFLAVMDGTAITNLRTGAQGAVALKYLHDGPAIRLGLYGAGVQARAQTQAISGVFRIEALTVYDIRREAAEAFSREMAPAVHGKIRVVGAPADVAADSHAVICVTQSNAKFFRESWYRPGMLLLPLGSFQECEDECILGADKIIVDHVGQCLHRGALKELSEAGRIGERNIHATIGEIVAGKRPGRTSRSERILCVAIGTGAMDVAVATVAYRRARERGLGGRYAFV